VSGALPRAGSGGGMGFPPHRPRSRCATPAGERERAAGGTRDRWPGGLLPAGSIGRPCRRPGRRAAGPRHNRHRSGHAANRDHRVALECSAHDLESAAIGGSQGGGVDAREPPFDRGPEGVVPPRQAIVLAAEGTGDLGSVAERAKVGVSGFRGNQCQDGRRRHRRLRAGAGQRESAASGDCRDPEPGARHVHPRVRPGDPPAGTGAAPAEESPHAGSSRAQRRS
jgi:hypothetical protein